MIHAIPPLAILLEKGPAMFAFDFGRYLVAASVTSAVVWGLRRSSIAARKIQAREATAADRRREFLQSLQTVATYLFVGLFIVWGVDSGVLHRFQGSYGLFGDMALLAAIIVAHDAYFYWVHRAMHHPKLFKTFHRAHHRSVTPTPSSPSRPPPAAGARIRTAASPACRANASPMTPRRWSRTRPTSTPP
jgi:sterol desaturase/sphingolipid hydroxylase (fatty acid hydroxylase superfamily)